MPAHNNEALLQKERKKTKECRDTVPSRSTFKNTSEPKLIEDALPDSKETLQALIDAISETVLLVDIDGTILAINEIGARRLAHRVADLVGQNAYDYFSPDLAKQRREKSDAVISTGKPVHFFDERSEKHFYNNLYPVFDADGNVKNIAIFSRDLSFQRQIENELSQRTIELQDRIRELNCLYGISHLIENQNLTIEEIFQGTIDLIRIAWKSPEITCARIIFKEQEYKTENFRETDWKQARNLVVYGESMGVLEVCYLEEKPVMGHDGPFLKKERALIDTIAERLGHVAERFQAEKALQESEEKYRLVVDNATIGIVITQDGLLKFVSPQTGRISGYSETELTAMPFTDFIHPDDRAMVMENHIERLKGEAVPETYFFRIITRDGQTKWLENKGVLISWENSPATLNFLSDVTERRQSEDRVRNLSQMLIQTQERERQMISYELHDRVAQNLSTLKIGCDMLFNGKPDTSPELIEKTAKLSKIIEQTITTVRNLAYDLRPPGLDDMGIGKAIEIYCEEFSEHSGLKIDFQSAGLHTFDLGYHTKINLYRLVQEGLNNTRKHADAHQATVILIGASPNIILRIEDDGKGFDVQARELALDGEKRMGLRSMRERVNLLKGQMTVQSNPMKGTKVFIKLPIKEKNRESEKTRNNH
ncbi:PAS domain S-box protein [Thermodesulfobacteriota bacterium]